MCKRLTCPLLWILGLGLTVGSVSGGVLLVQDDFAGSTLDTGKWQTIDGSGVTITQSDGRVFFNRPSTQLNYLVTTGQFDPAVTPLIITGSVQLGADADMDVWTRANIIANTGSGPTHVLDSGIRINFWRDAVISGYPPNLDILEKTPGVWPWDSTISDGANITGDTAAVDWSFVITDDGKTITATFTQTSDASNTLTLTGTSSTHFATNYVAFTVVNGYLNDVAISTSKLGAASSGPSPADRAIDVPHDVVLDWRPGEYAKTHDVYLGTGFNDVNDANRTNPLAVLVSQGQDANTYDPANPLAFGQTYYWRVDEVNAPPDGTIYKGSTWRFTIETYGYPVKPIKATASSSMTATMGPDKTIDGSGLDAGDQHSVSAAQMWLSKKGQSPIWIQYEFDKTYNLYQIWVWNSNQAVEASVGFGAKDVTIETSLDGTTWTALAGVPEFADATGEPNYVHNTTVDFGGVQAKYVKLTITSNWAGGTKQAGLSEVRFFYVPVKAFGPSPASGATGVALDAVLNWRPGREAAGHDVYVSSDPNAVAKGTAPHRTVTAHSLGLGPLGLEYGRTYYWKVNEVNDAATPASWEGDVWSFTTIGYAVVDDFESYDDTCNRIFFSWVDGFGHSGSADCSVAPSAGNGTGSTVGNVSAPFAERTIVHSGRQSMPLAYDNTKGTFYSETQREWVVPQSWTGGGVNTLVVYLRGDAAAFAETSSGTLIMNGTGTDIWANSDQFRLAYKRLTGNGSIVARVDSVALTNPWSKAGVMIRETLGTGSTHAMIVVSGSSGISFQRRLATDDVSYNTDAAGLAAPYWVKLTRTGNTFTSQYSADGVTWVDLTVTPAVTITMVNEVYIGLAVTSHSAGVACGAKFSNVSTAGGVSGSWLTADIGAVQINGNMPETFYVAVQDSAGEMRVVSNPDPGEIAMGIWRQWSIPLSQFTSAGVNAGSINKVVVGVGDRIAPKAGGIGKLYIDDVRLTRVSPP